MSDENAKINNNNNTNNNNNNNNSNNNNKNKQNETDDELSELLDSALDDFTNEPKTTVQDYNEELMKKASEVFQSEFGLTGDNNELSQEKIEEAQKRMMDMMQSSEFQSFATTITEAIQGINQSANETSTGNLFGNGGNTGVGLPDDSNFLNILDQNAPIMPFMQGMMQNLLSKDVLYPSIKEIYDNFPSWLDSNADKLTQEEKNKYENQRKLMGDVCDELEKENDNDGDDIKKKRFEKVLELMQRMQEYGDPPADLVKGDLPPATPECCLM